jgi:NgoMIV restriction enzyme
MSTLAQRRSDFLRRCLSGPITVDDNGVPSIADISNKASREISAGLIDKIEHLAERRKKLPGQQAGSLFEVECANFVSLCLADLARMRPGRFTVARNREISEFEQFSHLEDLRVISAQNQELKILLGGDYLIKPDVVVIRAPEPDTGINQLAGYVDNSVGTYSPLRSANMALPFLHASISCKLTIRSDRVQNTRSEALNLIRNRKGALPHIVAVTAEPTPSRIAAIALGTGDIDCVYHFALYELLAVLKDQNRDSLELMETMIKGKRLRDMSDLPLDLVI